jgi:hypothetical protein
MFLLHAEERREIHTEFKRKTRMGETILEPYTQMDDNIKVDLKGIECRLNLAEDRHQCQTFVNMVKNLWVP